MSINWMSDGIFGLPPTSFYITIAAIVVSVAYYFVNNRGLPPGPTGLPYLGFWPFIDHENTHVQFDEMKKKYGDVFSVTISGTLYINLGTSKALREAHVAKSDCFVNRLEKFTLLNDSLAGGVAFTNNDEWKTNRKVFLQILKERMSLSVKDMLAGSLYDAVNSTIEELREKKGEPVDIVDFLTNKANANMRLVFFGENGMSHESVREINEGFALLNACMTAPNFLITGPIAKYIVFPFFPGYKEAMASLRRIRQIIYQTIDEHKSTYDENHPRDIIDDYIKERSIRRSKGDPTAKYFTDESLMGTLTQILGDGVLTVASFIALFLNILLEHPEEQEKIYRELVEVVGHDRQPTIEDKSRLSYTTAFIQEALRTTDQFPFFPSQECSKDTTVGGYRIPKGSVTLMNIYSIHNDPKTYKEPHTFNPSRFISTDENRKPEPIVTFGIGKRSCIGEAYTMLQVFLFITALVKNFKILAPQGSKGNNFQWLIEGKLNVLLEPRNTK